jgi:hypothetical protein
VWKLYTQVAHAARDGVLTVSIGGAMLERAVRVEHQRDIGAAPERVWSLVGSSVAWSLLPGRFAFDVAGAPADAGRLMICIGPAGAGCEVWQAVAGGAGRMIRWWSHGTEPTRRLMVTLSTLPAGPGAAARISVSERVPRRSAAGVTGWWQRELGGWLDRVQAAAEGKVPLPGAGIPAGIAGALTAFPAIGASVQASASALIAAPPPAVWHAVWSPETTVTTNRATLAAGHVPGSPYRHAGEMQWFVHRQPDGRLTADVLVVQELEDQRRAVTRELNPPHSLMDHLVTAEGNGTRVTLTCTLPVAGKPRRNARDRLEITELVRTTVTTYKHLIEGTSND